jgi:hypothetical protein
MITARVASTTVICINVFNNGICDSRKIFIKGISDDWAIHSVPAISIY